jgi:hypothetical protein
MVSAQPRKPKTPAIRLWAEKHLYASYYRNKSMPGEIHRRPEDFSGRNLQPGMQQKRSLKTGPYADRQNGLPFLEEREKQLRKAEVESKRGLLSSW